MIRADSIGARTAHLQLHSRIGIGGRVSHLPCPTSVDAGPHTAVRRVKLRVNSRAFCIMYHQEAIRSLRGRPSGLHPYLPPEGRTILAFLPPVVAEIALLTGLSLYFPCGVPFGPSSAVPEYYALG